MKEHSLEEAIEIIPNRSKIFTHCYSTSILKLLIAAKKAGRKFEVYNTEVRPKYLGRRMAKELAEAKIKVTHFPDLAGPEALLECELLLFGAEKVHPDKSITNKIGTRTLIDKANKNKIPAYCITTTNKKTKTRINNKKHLWSTAPKGITIKNPGHEKISYKSSSYILLSLKA